MGDKDLMDQEEIYSKVLRAGRRTYFFDVRRPKAKNLHTTTVLFIIKNIRYTSIKKILQLLEILCLK